MSSTLKSLTSNSGDTTVLTNINQYKDFLDELKKNNGSTSLEFRKRMSEEAFIETGYYDSVIANYFLEISKKSFAKMRFP